jgi:hypothetical protein
MSMDYVRYDHDKVSEEFKQLADLAGALYRANLEDSRRDSSAANAHDELLARLCVYGYLYDRHFVQTRQALLAELRWLLATRRPITPHQAIDPEVFDAYRGALLKMLIRRFEQVAPDVVDDEPHAPVNPRTSAELRLTGAAWARSRARKFR